MNLNTPELTINSAPSLQSTIDFIVLNIIEFFFYVCIPLTVLSLIRVFSTGFLPVMLLHVFLMIFLSFCYSYRSRLSSSFLSIVIVSIFFLIALGGFFTHYITIYLFPATVLSLAFCALLMSKRAAHILLGIESTTLLLLAAFASKTVLSQSIFEVLVYIVFSYFLIFAILRVKFSFLILIKSLNEKDIAEKEAKEKLTKAYDSKSRFLALMSHEIRTPLNTILLASENLQNSKLDNQQRELLEVIGNSNNTIQLLIKDILNFTKGESGKDQVEKVSFNLNTLGEKIIQQSKPNNPHSTVQLNYFFKLENNFYLGDHVKIGQIITNLVSNSLKFTNEGEITLTISPSREAKGVIILVEDTGIGIEPDRLEAIFNEFEQEDNTTTRLFGGTGLGLAIVRQLVQLMNGTLTLESEKNIGSIFRVELPLEAGPPPPLQRDNTENRSPLNKSKLRHTRLLLFEDNETNANLMLKRLEKMGFGYLSSAQNGKQGLELMEVERFDIILMDIQMPILNGVETTKLIRQKTIGANSKDIPIIGLSANSFREDIDLALNAGMNDYLSKPARKGELEAVLKRYLTEASLDPKA